MIERIVFAPQPLFLLPEYRGRAEAAPGLREAVAGAVRRLSGLERLVVVAGYEPDLRTARLPAGLRVAHQMLAEAGIADHLTDLPHDVRVPLGLPTGACLQAGQEVAGQLARGAPTGVLVLADGSARRGEKAPGYVDERAFAYDAAFVRAIERGAPDELAALDAGLAAELLFQGRAALQVTAGAVGELSPSTIMHFTGDPFGVMYVVAEWQLD